MYLTMNGNAIGSLISTQKQTTWRTGTGMFTASTTGTVTIGLYNTIGSSDGNDFYIGEVTMKER